MVIKLPMASSTKRLDTSSNGDGGPPSAERLAEVREAMKTVKEISDLLNTGLDDETLRICVQLLEAGVNPEALANVVQELRREVAAIKEEEEAKR